MSATDTVTAKNPTPTKGKKKPDAVVAPKKKKLALAPAKKKVANTPPVQEEHAAEVTPPAASVDTSQEKPPAAARKRQNAATAAAVPKEVTTTVAAVSLKRRPLSKRFKLLQKTYQEMTGKSSITKGPIHNLIIRNGTFERILRNAIAEVLPIGRTQFMVTGTLLSRIVQVKPP
jgi:hypothetical protein